MEGVGVECVGVARCERCVWKVWVWQCVGVLWQGVGVARCDMEDVVGKV